MRVLAIDPGNVESAYAVGLTYIETKMKGEDPCENTGKCTRATDANR